MPLEVGAQAPEFTLKDQNNQPVSLSDYRGRKNVLLIFFPLAFTGTCQGELCRVRDELPKFENDETAVVAISVGPPPTHKIWAAEQGYLFPLLSDFWPHGEVAQQYGVFNEKLGFANRGTFLVDTEGVIRFAEMMGPGEARDQGAWENALAALGS
ncbi:peroxiredoxin [Rhodococcus kroppenstedtii]|uniref:Peroxiredoxin n=1 Tax=Rhodococcoides kroppenstedtii TaxID=293050 RepID=A0ABS7NQE8_9NOCA|nr:MULTISPECIES: peroxiredoxin [Rhodococcus]AMY18510.1 Putative peroxiredoxin [Rhodococcus sp. PBTS 1]MBT1193598.1 peroxiredoxin [Rhodococcus kroppenstedtii]MBY6312467.1 peroxiredoxin [Rhodococcus kroppenstedtii]MBY6320221.1 peroxiredoxin [Rhodococcus kroppenstedtii]MBY6398758.1 peroxiredoxin [Rhodococcus kroppenstedtii]